jgi:RNA polymerase sigma-70 factor (ECF subfamily)
MHGYLIGDSGLTDVDKRHSFDLLMLPHMDAAWNLARWLMRNDHDAEDVVQDAFVRAWRFYDGFHGSQSRPWLLAIVRNTAYSWMEKNRGGHELEDDDRIDEGDVDIGPEALAIRGDEKRRLNVALDLLPAQYREVIVLRELEDFSYREIAQIAAIPVGTVMSRLARGRKLLTNLLAAGRKETMR